jgi:hypothetical protein
LTANGRQIVGFNPPIILYFTANESIVVSAGRTSYSLVGDGSRCYTTSDTSCQSHVRYYGDWYCVTTYICIRQYTEWGRTYKLQAIELVDWDTGEVYASVNQTSVTFNINANTIVRFKYVLVDSWSRSWEVIIEPPTPEPNQCQQILNDPSKKGSPEWCACARIYDPEAYDKWCKQSCLYVSVSPCCTGDTSSGCLDSWSGRGGRHCERIPSGTTRTLSAGWSASWSLKPGWVLADIGKTGPADCKIPPGGISGNSASGTCSVDAEPNRGYHVSVIVIFKKTQ